MINRIQKMDLLVKFRAVNNNLTQLYKIFKCITGNESTSNYW